MKQIGAALRKVFRLGDSQAVLIILSAAFVNVYAIMKLEPSSLPAMAAFLYSVYGLIVLIVKMREWLTRLNRRIRRRFPKYDRFCALQAESLNSRGKGAKAIYITLRVLTIACAVAMLIQGEYGNFALCILTLLLFTLPDIIQQNFAVHLPTTLETIIYCFIFCAEVLGEINNFYQSLQLRHQKSFPNPGQECCMGNPELSSGFPGGYLSTLPHFRIPFIGLTAFLARSAHMYTTGLCAAMPSACRCRMKARSVSAT